MTSRALACLHDLIAGCLLFGVGVAVFVVPMAPMIVLALAHVHSDRAMAISELLYGVLLAILYVTGTTKNPRDLLVGGGARRYTLFFLAFYATPLFVALFFAGFYVLVWLPLLQQSHSLFPPWGTSLYILSGLFLTTGLCTVSARARQRWERWARAYRRARPPAEGE